MRSFSYFSHKSLLGKCIRLPLKLIPQETIVRLLGGHGKGLRWIKGSGDNSYWLGRYEPDKGDIFVNMLAPGITLYDIGAHVGYYTILGAQRVGPAGHVIAIEPDKRNVEYIERHSKENELDYIEVIRGVATDIDGSTTFQKGESTSNGYLSRYGDSVVPAFRIDTLVEGKEIFSPDMVKIDVQGATMHVLRGMENTIRVYRPRMLIAIDSGKRPGLGEFQNSDVYEFLAEKGYRIFSLKREELNRETIVKHNEIIAES